MVVSINQELILATPVASAHRYFILRRLISDASDFCQEENGYPLLILPAAYGDTVQNLNPMCLFLCLFSRPADIRKRGRQTYPKRWAPHGRALALSLMHQAPVKQASAPLEPRLCFSPEVGPFIVSFFRISVFISSTTNREVRRICSLISPSTKSPFRSAIA